MYRWVDCTLCINCSVQQPAHTTSGVSIVKTVQLTAFRKATADKSQNRRKLINVFITLNAEAGDTYNYQQAMKNYTKINVSVAFNEQIAEIRYNCHYSIIQIFTYLRS
jgi:hypothetical protein